MEGEREEGKVGGSGRRGGGGTGHVDCAWHPSCCSPSQVFPATGLLFPLNVIVSKKGLTLGTERVPVGRGRAAGVWVLCWAGRGGPGKVSGVVPRSLPAPNHTRTNEHSLFSSRAQQLARVLLS